MEHSVYINGIKKILKTHRTTYAELAAALKMTESGVKKMLNAKDISLRRVLRICEVLDVSPGQLFSLSEAAAIHEAELTELQQESLLKDRGLLAVYWWWTIEKLDLNAIALRRKEKVSETKKVLQRLVRLGLLLNRKGGFVPFHRGKFRWNDQSKLAVALNREWSQITLKQALRSKSNNTHRWMAGRLSSESLQKMKDKLLTVLEEAALQSERDENSLPASHLRNFTALVAVASGGVFDHLDPHPSQIET